MRSSDWSSDVCSSDLPLNVENQDRVLSQFRILGSWRSIRDLILAGLIAFGFGGAGIWLHLYGADVPVATLDSVATVVGGSSILVAAFGIFYQGRIKARAENSQAWTNELREEINQILADLPRWVDHQDASILKEKLREIETRNAKKIGREHA